MTGGEGRWKAVEGGAALRQPTVIVSAKGAARWQAGHPWIYRTDLYDEPGDTPAIVAVTDRRGRHLGPALHSPRPAGSLPPLTPRRAAPRRRGGARACPSFARGRRGRARAGRTTATGRGGPPRRRAPRPGGVQ